MAVTKMSDVINPEVMGPMIDAKIEALAKITPYMLDVFYPKEIDKIKNRIDHFSKIRAFWESKSE